MVLKRYLKCLTFTSMLEKSTWKCEAAHMLAPARLHVIWALSGKDNKTKQNKKHKFSESAMSI